MSVFRVHKTKDFTILSNHHLKDKGLSLQAKGLLSVMLSLPDDWKYSIGGLAAISKEGKKAIKSTLDELKERGYLVVTKHPPKQGTGFFSYEYDVFERPVSTKPQVAQAYPSVGLQQVTLQAEGLQQEWLQDGTLLSTQEQRTYESSTDNKRLTSSRTSLSGKPDDADVPYGDVIAYLNEKSGKHYRVGTEATRRMIRARFLDGYTLDDFKHVIDVKVSQWLGTEQEKYLRPETLFRPSHFESYLNEAPQRQSALDQVDWSLYQMKEWRPKGAE